MVMINHPTPQDIAAQIAAKYPDKVDPARLERAVVLVSSRSLDMAHVDEEGKPITPSWDVLTLRFGQRYIIRKGKCTCPDNKFGHVCKHRLAFYIFRQIMQ